MADASQPPVSWTHLLAVLGGLCVSSPTLADCMIPGAEPPQRDHVLPKVDHGQAGREIMSAVFAGDHAAVERMLLHDPPLVRTSDRDSADLLSVAIGRCDRQMVELLLHHGAPPDGPNDEQPLGLALYSTDPWYAERLLKAGAKVNWTSDQHDRPLDNAVDAGSRGAVRLLLDHGADPSLQDSVGDTPLAGAMSIGRFELAEIMLAHGADPFTVDVNGSTPANWILHAPSAEGEIGAARERVIARLKAMHAWPAPDNAEVRALVFAGRWPPPETSGRKPPEAIVRQMHLNWDHPTRSKGAHPPA